ncbi:hypothetical protein JAAARDRAFT_37006 [Jaapia argillacea MUCL 33604]|uniref:DUF6593 domain-containing protein n=1 Tax=Jaapia argillacea MUCL 33604 TaxID=933084 RepID=A0A067PL22_9AGAM|nr:hypothetical protein JAAARDRAFT_37006 [Jaapia argillacea MUCL 33604]
MTNYGLPFFLEDKTGSLSGSEFVDIHDRMRMTFRCTARDTQHSAYMVYNLTVPRHGGQYKPGAVLDFGPGNSLGTVMIGSGVHIPMAKYLIKTSAFGNSKARKFTASDGQEYRWTYKNRDNHEWACLNSSGYLVACYNLKLAGEPHYSGTSGCMLTIDESYPHLAVELLASLIIMRHIAAYDL